MKQTLNIMNYFIRYHSGGLFKDEKSDNKWILWVDALEKLVNSKVRVFWQTKNCLCNLTK